MTGANDDLAGRIRAWIRQHSPGPGTVRIECDVTDGAIGRLVIDWRPSAGANAGGAADPAEEWLPTENQLAVLDALEGKALKADALASQSGVDRRQLFRELPELRERGLVGHHPRRGYFRPDAPPEELSEATR